MSESRFRAVDPADLLWDAPPSTRPSTPPDSPSVRSDVDDVPVSLEPARTRTRSITAPGIARAPGLPAAPALAAARRPSHRPTLSEFRRPERGPSDVVEVRESIVLGEPRTRRAG